MKLPQYSVAISGKLKNRPAEMLHVKDKGVLPTIGETIQVQSVFLDQDIWTTVKVSSISNSGLYFLETLHKVNDNGQQQVGTEPASAS